LHRAHRNASQLGSAERRFSSGWAIGSWFVPFLNFWRPKQVVDDVWRGSDPEGSRSTELIPVWWGLFIAAGIVGNIASRIPSTTLDDLRIQNTVDLVALVLSVGAAIAAVMVVRRITDRQERRAELLSAA
jgi:Domain of unknown function (DUF4328)